MRTKEPKSLNRHQPHSSLQSDKPWPGYDELGMEEVHAALAEGDEQRVNDVRTYERKRKDRAGVIRRPKVQPSTV